MSRIPFEPTPRRFKKKRLNPYKLLTILLYGDHEFIDWSQGPPEQVVILTGPMSRLLGVQPDALREYLEYLEHFGYLHGYERMRGKARFSVRVPPNIGLDLNALRGQLEASDGIPEEVE